MMMMERKTTYQIELNLTFYTNNTASKSHIPPPDFGIMVTLPSARKPPLDSSLVWILMSASTMYHVRTAKTAKTAETAKSHCIENDRAACRQERARQRHNQWWWPR
jgi:hypothetical protein